MTRWLRLVVDQPFWAGRSCDDCAKFVFGANGQVSTVPGPDGRAELPMLRSEVFQESLRKPPCERCPKCPPGRDKSPTTGREVDGPIWIELLRWFLEGRVVGFPRHISPVLAEVAAACAGFLATRALEEDTLRRARQPVPRPAEWVLNGIAYY